MDEELALSPESLSCIYLLREADKKGYISKGNLRRILHFKGLQSAKDLELNKNALRLLSMSNRYNPNRWFVSSDVERFIELTDKFYGHGISDLAKALGLDINEFAQVVRNCPYNQEPVFNGNAIDTSPFVRSYEDRDHFVFAQELFREWINEHGKDARISVFLFPSPAICPDGLTGVLRKAFLE